jgi:hypothetical protein
MATFDDVLNRIADRVRDGKLIGNESFVDRELRFLRVIYNRMAEFKELGPLSMEEIEARDITNKTIVDYNSFIGHLNRLGRILDKTGLSSRIIPNYPRIHFYRNKTIEHWDDYIRYTSTGRGYVKRKGEVALPMNSGIYPPEKRKKLHVELSTLLGTPLHDNYVVSNPTVMEGYNDDIYSILEKIDPQLGRKKIDEVLVKKLFLFGFPLPIVQMDEFIDALCENLMQAYS